MRDACVTIGPTCDREVRFEDDATMVTGALAVTGKVGYGIVVRSALVKLADLTLEAVSATLTEFLVRRA